MKFPDVDIRRIRRQNVGRPMRRMIAQKSGETDQAYIHRALQKNKSLVPFGARLNRYMAFFEKTVGPGQIWVADHQTETVSLVGFPKKDK